MFLGNGFEGEGSVILDYDGMLLCIAYSKITEGILPSFIEGEEGSVVIDKLTQPSSITLKMRDGREERLPLRPTDNNMTYEIEAFCQMVEGKSSHLPYLKITENAQVLVDRIYKATGTDSHF